jgi:hypothetical protein
MWHQLFLHEIQRITPLLLWNTWNKKPPNSLHENNPLPLAPNVCVPEVFNYTDFTKVAILSSDTEKLGDIQIAVTSNLQRSGDLRTRLKQNWKPRRDFVRKCIYNVVCLFDRNQNLLRFHKSCYLVERYRKAWWYTLHSVCWIAFPFFFNLKLRYFQNALIWQYVFVL